MPKLRRLSGSAVVHILEGFGFIVRAQAGSHIKLRRIGPQGQRQMLMIPHHTELLHPCGDPLPDTCRRSNYRS